MDSGLGVGVDVGILLFALLERPSRVGVVEMGGRRDMKAWFGPGEDLDCTRGEGDSIEPVMMEVRNGVRMSLWQFKLQPIEGCECVSAVDAMIPSRNQETITKRLQISLVRGMRP